MRCYTKKDEVKFISATAGREFTFDTEEAIYENNFEKLQQSIANLKEISIEEWLNKLEAEIIKAIKANSKNK